LGLMLSAAPNARDRCYSYGYEIDTFFPINDEFVDEFAMEFDGLA
jgi:hypothetical protein